MASNVLVRAILWATMVALVVYADDNCCAPDQFVIEAEQLQGLVVAGKQLAQINDLTLACDFANMKVGQEIVSTTAGHTVNIKIIIDYKTKEKYTIIGQKCTKSEAPDDYQQCIPKKAILDDTTSLGDNELTLDNYSYDEDIPKVLRGKVRVGVTRNECIPVRTGIIGEVTQTDPPIPLVSGTCYSNYKKGISDPDRWFKVPAICQKAKSDRFAREAATLDADEESTHNLATLINHIVLAPYYKK